MRRVIVILLVMSVNAVLWSATRSPQQVMSIAGSFMHGRASANGKHSIPSASSPQIVSQSASYYAINIDGSYVLVSADDRLPEVLGYSDSGTFDTDNMSPATRYWLACYDEELASINNQQLTMSSARHAVPAIEPLMTSKWNQSSPYNDLAPMYNDNGGQCVTGCVATAMAQVMYFYRYPQKGIGSHSYLWICTEPAGKSGTLSANFGNTTYDWANMLDSYRSGYTDVQSNAVATLMYHCGVSIDMGYGQSSGAYTEQVPVALKNYFGYDANYQRIRKIMYPADSLNAIIAAELSADRPVIVSGHNDEGGHAFVCDGCDTRGYFHINWGWGGSNDGYYLLTALNPGRSQGIGGTTKGYNKGTSFFVGLQPAQTNSPKAIPQMATTRFSVSSQSFSRGASFTVSIAQLQNYGLTDYSGSYGVALYDEDETTLVRVLKQVDNYSLNAGFYRTSSADITTSIPTSTSTLPNGTYHLCVVYRDANYGWMRMMCTEDDYYKTVELSGNMVTFYANDAAPELTLTLPLVFPEGTNPDSVPKTGIPVSFSIRNTGGTFRGDISARVYKGSFAKGQYEIMDSVVIRRNQSLSSALQQKFDAALELNQQYKMKLCWRAGEGDNWHDFDGTLPFKLYDPDYHLSLTDTIRFDRNDSVPRSNANLNYSIRNTGAPFDGELQVSFYQTYFSRGKSEIREVYIGTNDTLTGVFSGPLEQEAGIYDVVLRYRDQDGDWQDFIDINDNNIGAIVATVYDDTVSTEINNRQLSTVNSQLLMHLGAYDLYVVITREGNKQKHKKVFIPIQ
ncbi:MAG: C10 family peptidase [Paludibacteraceae bacterium]|nr:C10 family peptidase [Paludibacteraceae bacterium]